MYLLVSSIKSMSDACHSASPLPPLVVPLLCSHCESIKPPVIKMNIIYITLLYKKILLVFFYILFFSLVKVFIVVYILGKCRNKFH